MVDTHCHLNFKAFNKDRFLVLERSFNKGVKFILNVGSNLKTSKKAVSIAQKYRQCYASLGIHPLHALEAEDGWEKELFLLTRKERVAALGETGLDYFRLEKRASSFLPAGRETVSSLIEQQKKIFIQHLQLARQLKLPLILHCRNAFQDLLGIFSDLAVDNSVVHCFTGTAEQAKKFLDLGCWIGFTGLITFVKDLEAVVKFVPLKKILLETDCPYLSPAPDRGQRCEPWMVKFTAQKISQIKKKKLEEIIIETTRNAQKLFGLSK